MKHLCNLHRTKLALRKCQAWWACALHFTTCPITEFFKSCCSHNSCEGFGHASTMAPRFNTLIPSHWIEVDIERLLFRLSVKMPNFWGPKIDKKVISSPTKCLISVKIAILTPYIIPPPLVNIWLIFDLQKYDFRMFLEVNPIRTYLYPFVPTRKSWHHPSSWTFSIISLNLTNLPFLSWSHTFVVLHISKQ